MNNNQHQIEMPLVSVIIPAYNAEVFIERTLDSVLNQTYRDIEVLVVDDGSQDRTTEIVKRVAQSDCRVILLRQSNAGVAAARNLAIQKSKGKYIAPIDADDIWYPQNIEKQVQCMSQAESSVGLVYSWSVDIDEKDSLTGAFRAAKLEGQVYPTLLCHNFLGNASASMIRRTCLEKVGNYSCELKQQDAQGCEDWDLYLRIAEHYQFKVVPEFLIGYRKLLNSMSRNYSQMAKSHTLMLQTVRQKHPEIPTVIYSLSSSNLYIYFAHQSSLCGDERLTLFWLYQALKSECITPFLRYGFYKLSIKSLFSLIYQSASYLIFPGKNYFLQFKQKLVFEKQVIKNTNLDPTKNAVKLMVTVENIFYRLVQIITRIT